MHRSVLLGVSYLAALVLSCARHESSSRSQLATAASSIDAGITAKPRATERDANATLAQALPDHAGPFTAGPALEDPLFVRRSYARGPAHISVTISVPNATPIEYQEWVRMSADSPQVRLNLAPGLGAGFYDCARKDLEGRCNVHIHLRAGYHIEMMGEQAAYRADFDDLLAALRLRTLAE